MASSKREAGLAVDITFERGDEAAPRGHAILYFRSRSDADEIWATYVVILPIAVDVSKYVPPFLMNQVAQAGPTELSAFAFPPAPERVGSRQALEEMASRREDDVLYCGTFDAGDVASAMMSVNEAVQTYADRCGPIDAGEPEEAGDDDELGVSEVLYGLMNDADKLGELTSLVGRLKFAVEGSDDTQARDAEREMSALARHLPADNQVHLLIAALKSSDSRGARLADLYLQRCYHLVKEEYREMAAIDRQLSELETEDAQNNIS